MRAAGPGGQPTFASARALPPMLQSSIANPPNWETKAVKAGCALMYTSGLLGLGGSFCARGMRVWEWQGVRLEALLACKQWRECK